MDIKILPSSTEHKREADPFKPIKTDDVATIKTLADKNNYQTQTTV